MAFLQPINVKASIDKKKVEITRFTVLVTLTRKDTLSMAKPEGLLIDSKPTRPLVTQPKHTDLIKRDAQIILLITGPPAGKVEEGREKAVGRSQNQVKPQVCHDGTMIN